MVTQPGFAIGLCGLVLLVSQSACSMRSGGAQNGKEAGQLITGETIRDSGLTTAWDVLRRYANHLSFSEHERGPVRVTRRGRESIYLTEAPLLIVDGIKVRDFRVLTSMPARDLESMRILSGSEASTRHGIHAASGAIIVRTLHPEPAPTPTDTTRIKG